MKKQPANSQPNFKVIVKPGIPTPTNLRDLNVEKPEIDQGVPTYIQSRDRYELRVIHDQLMVQEEWTDVHATDKINFIGAGVTATWNPVTSAIDVDIVWVALNCSAVQTCIENFTTLDLSTVQVTLGEIFGDITFWLNTTIDWTNTNNTGIQNFDNNYTANYDWSIINYTSVVFNSVTSVYNYSGDIITYTGVVFNSYYSTYNYNQDIFNYTQVTQNFINSVINFDSTTNVYFGGDIYLGWNIINITNNYNNWTVVVGEGAGTPWTNITNMLTCNWQSAVSTPVSSALTQDRVQLVVGWIRAWSPISNYSDTWTPGVYGWAGEMWNLPLTPAMVNHPNFWVSFKFGDSDYALITGFNFAIPLTDTITGIKIEVVYSFVVDTLSVDCVIMTVYSTDGSTFQSGVDVYEAGVLKVAAAKSLDFNSNAIVTDMWGWVARVDVTGWGGGWSGLYNVASDNDSFTGDWTEDTWLLPSTPIDSNLLHLTTDSGTNLIVWVDYLLVWNTITFINTIPLNEIVYARWVLANPPVTPVSLNTNTHNAINGEYIVVTYAAGDTTINLPDASTNNGSVIKVKKFTWEDIRVVSIVPYWPDLIDWYTGATMSINRTMFTFTCVDGNWYLGD